MRAQIDEASVIKANAQFWEQMLAMELDHLPTAGEFCVSAGHILACVQLNGVWTGRVEVRLAGELAIAATAAMMMQPADTVSEADTLDATKEIANMIAGTLKSSLPRPCSMTVPESSIEMVCFCGPRETEDTILVAFRHETGDLMVRVWEQDCKVEPEGQG
ncbi:MAG: chemotaxis protein CheX [Terracidiphilus sp.]|nr:chemotaxis protein CheX [Terracidiphilus sp.]